MKQQNRMPLWLACRQCLGGHLEIRNDGFEQWVPVLNYDSCIESLSFNNGTCSTNGKPVRSSMFLKPCKKQTVTVGLAPVAVVAHVEQNVKVLFEKYIKDGKNGLFYFCIMLNKK